MSGSAKILNYTPHKITIYDQQKNGTIIAEFPSDGVLRCTQSYSESKGVVVTKNGEIPLVAAPKFLDVKPMNLLEQSKGFHIIVSMPVGQMLSASGSSIKKYFGIHSIFGPDTGPEAVVRDTNGRIIGTTRLIKYI